MRRILIADDNDAIVDILKSFAEAEGYETVTAGDGEEALSVFQKEHFDAVLLDVIEAKSEDLDNDLKEDSHPVGVRILMLL